MSNEGDYNSNNKKTVLLTTNTTKSLAALGKQQQIQQKIADGQQLQDGQDHSHTGENRHSKKIKEELKEHKEEQLILLKEYKQNIIDFLLYNKDSIRIEDLKIFEPVYKCYREKGNCHTCNSLANIISKNCNNDNHSYNKEVWLCLNHWQEYTIEKHKYQI